MLLLLTKPQVELASFYIIYRVGRSFGRAADYDAVGPQARYV